MIPANTSGNEDVCHSLEVIMTAAIVPLEKWSPRGRGASEGVNSVREIFS